MLFIIFPKSVWYTFTSYSFKEMANSVKNSYYKQFDCKDIPEKLKFNVRLFFKDNGLPIKHPNTVVNTPDKKDKLIYIF